MVNEISNVQFFDDGLSRSRAGLDHIFVNGIDMDRARMDGDYFASHVLGIDIAVPDFTNAYTWTGTVSKKPKPREQVGHILW